MAQIYIQDWDFSCSNFAITDNNTAWLVRILADPVWGTRDYYKKNQIPCIFGLVKNYQGRWAQPFALICQGINSTKTQTDRENATWIQSHEGESGVSIFDCNSWITITLEEYPTTIFYVNRGSRGLSGPYTLCTVREPLIECDLADFNNDFTADWLRDTLRRIQFAPGGPTPGLDPYSPDGPSDTGGGNGNHDKTSDPVPTSPLPSLAAADTKFITLYNPSVSELNSLAAWMWSPLCVIEDLRKLWNNPMQGILGLSIVPVQPSRAATPTTIYLGNLESNTTAYKITSQYVSVPMGFVSVAEYWGSYLDYAPYTKIEIFLPYIGTRELNTDDVMGKDIYCYYHVDVLSGACVAQLMCGNAVLYQFAGNCASSIPITGNDWTNVINGVMSVAISTAMVATGGAVGGAASAAAAVSAVGSVAQNIASMKPTVMKSGSLAGGSGFLGGQRPYLIITRPNAAVPDGQNAYTGYPSWITTQLSNLVGLTYIAECHLEGIPCTTEEQDEIMNLLKGGVIL